MKSVASGSIPYYDSRGYAPGAHLSHITPDPETSGKYHSIMDSHVGESFASVLKRQREATRSNFPEYDEDRTELINANLTYVVGGRIGRGLLPSTKDPRILDQDLFFRKQRNVAGRSLNASVNVSRVVSEVQEMYWYNNPYDERHIDEEKLAANLRLLSSLVMQYLVGQENTIRVGASWIGEPQESLLYSRIEEVVRLRNQYLKTGRIEKEDEYFANFDGNDENDEIDWAPRSDGLSIVREDLDDLALLEEKIEQFLSLSTAAQEAVDAALAAKEKSPPGRLAEAEKAYANAVVELEKKSALARKILILTGERERLLEEKKDPVVDVSELELELAEKKRSLDESIERLAAEVKQEGDRARSMQNNIESKPENKNLRRWEEVLVNSKQTIAENMKEIKESEDARKEAILKFEAEKKSREAKRSKDIDARLQAIDAALLDDENRLNNPIIVSTKPPSDVTQTEVVLIRSIICANIVEAELLHMDFPGNGAEQRKGQARHASAMLSIERSYLDMDEAQKLSVMFTRPTLVFFDDPRVTLKSNAGTFTRNFTPTQHTMRAIQSILD